MERYNKEKEGIGMGVDLVNETGITFMANWCGW
jgi:hypothetical protein